MATSMISLQCGACRSTVELPATLAGMVSTCPHCQEAVRVPALPTEPTPTEPTPTEQPAQRPRRVIAVAGTATMLIIVIVLATAYVMHESGFGTIDQVKATLARWQLRPIDDPHHEIVRGRRLQAQSFATDANRPAETTISTYSDDAGNVLGISFFVRTESSDPIGELNWLAAISELTDKRALTNIKSILMLPKLQLGENDTTNISRVRSPHGGRLQFEYVTADPEPTSALVIIRDMKLW